MTGCSLSSNINSEQAPVYRPCGSNVNFYKANLKTYQNYNLEQSTVKRFYQDENYGNYHMDAKRTVNFQLGSLPIIMNASGSNASNHQQAPLVEQARAGKRKNTAADVQQHQFS